MKENLKDLNNGWIVYGLKDNVVKMAVFPKLFYRFSKIPIKIPTEFFVEIDKLILNFTWICKGPRIVKTTLEKKNKVGEFTLNLF